MTIGLVLSLLMAPNRAPAAKPGKLYYFIAIHVDPVSSNAEYQDSFDILQKIVATADTNHIKLTLMFTAQVAQYMATDKKALALLGSWAKNGHEIAAHHHDVYHGSGWDGYTDIPPGEVETILNDQGLSPSDFTFNGGLDEYVTAVTGIGALDNHAGCMDDDSDKRALPDEVLIDTCSGYVNYGTPGTAGDDGDAMKGYNQYVLTGKANGIERKWLSHQIVDSGDRLTQAKADFASVTKGVFGMVTHSSRDTNVLAVKNLVDFFKLKDPDASESVTLTQVIASKLLPEKGLPE